MSTNAPVSPISVNDIYVSRFLRGSDLPGTGWLLTVSDVTTEDLKDFNGNLRTKIILTVAEIEQQLALNGTQARSMMSLFGGDAQQWRGHQIVVAPEKLKTGQITIHISAAQPAQPAQPKAKRTPPPAPEPPTDENLTPPPAEEEE